MDITPGDSSVGRRIADNRAWVKRALIFAVVGVVSGAVAHTLAGGSLPGMTGLIPAMVLSTLVGLVLLKKKSVPGVVSSVLAGQWLFHQTASLASPIPHLHDHAVGTAVVGESASLAMGGGHLGAAVVTAIGVFWAEALWALASQVIETTSRLKIVRGLFSFVSFPVASSTTALSGTTSWFVKKVSVTSDRSTRGPPLLSGI